jgi:hypothetical protein
MKKHKHEMKNIKSTECPSWCQEDITCKDCGAISHLRMYESQQILIGTSEECIDRFVMRIIDETGREYFEVESPFGDFTIVRNIFEPKDQWEHRAFTALAFNYTAFANQVDSMMALKIMVGGAR